MVNYICNLGIVIMKFKSTLLLLAASLTIIACDDSEPVKNDKYISLSASGDYKNEYQVGECFDPTGLMFEAYTKKDCFTLTYESIKDELIFTPSLTTPLTVNDYSVKVEYKTVFTDVPIIVGDTAKATVSFENYDLGTAKQIYGTDANDTKILNYMKESDATLFTGFTSTRNNSVRIEMSEFLTGYQNVQALIVGTSKKDGSLTFNFSTTVKSVKIKAQQYYNIYNDYNTGSAIPWISYDGQEYNDETGKFEGYFELGINDQTWRGTGTTYILDDQQRPDLNNHPEINTGTFAINSNALTIYGYASIRTRIYEMTFYY